jgi:hypothetical protein
MGYPSFIFFGTLLGVVRDDALIPHDDDIDTICMLPEQVGANEGDYILQLEALLKEAGATVRGQYPYHRHVSIGRGSFDVFLGIEGKTTQTLYSWRTMTCDRDQLFPLKPRQFRDQEFLVPSDEEALLERYYGRTWRIPDKNFYDKSAVPTLDLGNITSGKT